MRPLIERAERYFEFAALGTSWRTEILAGVTTFMTMAWQPVVAR
jgi:AGZA family xanthine/uracil permease-like MFS transporter